MIDINVSYGSWPFSQTGWKSMEELEEHLFSCGIQHALVSHLGAVWDPDVEAYNRELIHNATKRKGVTPVPIVNPAWPAPFDWYKEEIDVIGVRVLPSFHGYSLDDEVMNPLVRYLIANECVLFVQMRLEDERMQHPSARVDGVSVEEVVRLHARFPDLKMICLNAYLPEVRLLSEQTPHIGFDTSFCEWLFTLECMLNVLPPSQIYLGTHTPLLYTKAGILKVSEARIDHAKKNQVLSQNAAALLGRSHRDSG